MKLSDLLQDIPNADHLPLRVQMKAKPTHGKAYVDKEGTSYLECSSHHKKTKN